MTRGQPITFRPKQGLRERLERLLELDPRNDISFLVNEALALHIDELERKYGESGPRRGAGAKYPTPRDERVIIEDKPRRKRSGGGDDDVTPQPGGPSKP